MKKVLTVLFILVVGAALPIPMIALADPFDGVMHGTVMKQEVYDTNKNGVVDSTDGSSINQSNINITGGVITGQMDVITCSTTTNLTLDQVRGTIIVMSANATVNLPIVSGAAADYGLSALFVVSDASTTAAINPDDADLIVLDGTALSDGDKLVCPGSAYDYISLVNIGATGWMSIGNPTTWTDGN